MHMSGGSMNYIYYQLEEAASMTEDAELADLLRDAAKVLHDEEWWRSADYGEETYRKSLAAFKEKWFGSDREERLRGYVDDQIGFAMKRCYDLIGCGKKVSEE